MGRRSNRYSGGINFLLLYTAAPRKMWGNKVLKSTVGVLVPAALVLGALEILLQVINKVGVVPVPPVPLKQFVHLALLSGQPVVVQLVQVFVGVQAEGSQAVFQAETLHVISQDDVELLQLGLGHSLQVVLVPRVVLQPFRRHAVV